MIVSIKKVPGKEARFGIRADEAFRKPDRLSALSWAARGVKGKMAIIVGKPGQLGPAIETVIAAIISSISLDGCRQLGSRVSIRANATAQHRPG
jgi:hypothetical protein